MKRTPYAGGLFVHELVSGERVILYPHSHLDTHLGRMDFPAGETYGLLFLHCTNVPEFKFSGLAHDAIASQMEWSQSQGWQRVPYITGRSVYDKQGVLRDTAPAGYQFVGDDGQPVSRLEAYETRNGLNEWTDTGGLLIGQGHEQGGVCIWDGGNLRVLDTGECYFVNVDRDGDQFVISYVKSGEGAIVVRANRSELVSLPILGTTIPDPGTPEPPQPPEPQPMPVPDESAFVASFLTTRLKNMGSEEATRIHSFEAVNACCVALRSKGDQRWGLLEKTGGANVRGRATDILLYVISTTEAQVIDVVNDAEGNPSPSWNPKDIRPIDQWRQPYPLSEEPPDPGPTPEPPPAVDLSEALKKLDAIALNQQDAALSQTSFARGVLDSLDAIEKRLAALESKEVKVEFPAYSGKLAYNMRLTPEALK